MDDTANDMGPTQNQECINPTVDEGLLPPNNDTKPRQYECINNEYKYDAVMGTVVEEESSYEEEQEDAYDDEIDIEEWAYDSDEENEEFT